jgi:hypothetical protein
MEEQQMQRQPRYFMAHFGEKYAREHPVDGGCYPVPSGFEAPQVISKGDRILLCCWGGHKGLFGGSAWGIGEVIHREQQGEDTAIYYDAEPWDKPIMRADIEACLSDEEKGKFKMGPIRKAFWLREVRPASFQCIVRGNKG